MLQEKIKQEIDTLSEAQLKQVESFIASIKIQSDRPQTSLRAWNTVTPEEWARDFREWTSQLPKNGVSLPDEAFDRGSIYGE
ncbi:MAG TPA: hypothetical protein VL134_06995 [Leptolyngbya sp.]|jgi:hypothetical protein|nr:hypothetical protein [Leptolyngbya sp.]